MKDLRYRMRSDWNQGFFVGCLRGAEDVSEGIVTEDEIGVKRDYGDELEALHWDHDCLRIYRESGPVA
jgi:hypothetical protein